MKPLEIEFKYKASCTLTEFIDFCKLQGSYKHVFSSGWDHFFHNVSNPDSFCRHRLGTDINQLTFKRKLSDANNYIRTEHNANLKDMEPAAVQAMIKEFGYEYNTTIFKNCFIFDFDRYIFVYYIIYDADMNEKGRFIEIEMAEKHPWKDEQEAWGALTVLEKVAKPLGISPQGRVKRSLYEMFKV